MVRNSIKKFIYTNQSVGRKSKYVQPHVRKCGLATPRFCLGVDRPHSLTQLYRINIMYKYDNIYTAIYRMTNIKMQRCSKLHKLWWLE